MMVLMITMLVLTTPGPPTEIPVMMNPAVVILGVKNLALALIGGPSTVLRT